MPIFEYICKDCENRFEVIVTGARKPQCPACNGKKLDQQISSFAVGTASAPSKSSAPAGPCGSCGDPRGPGACSLN